MTGKFGRFCFCALALAALSTPCGFGAEPVKPLPPEERPLIGEDAYLPMANFLAALAIIKTHYVDSDKVSYSQLFQAALRGLMRELDPFSQYESPDMFRATQEDSRGNFAGIGIVVSMRNRGMEIVSVMPDGPSAKAGLRGGDLILEVDAEPIDRLSLNECIAKLRGEPGSEVKLTVYRGSEDRRKTFTVRRAVIEISTIRGAKILPDSNGIGYVRVLQFGAKTAADFEKAVTALRKQGMTALVIDLRDNPGGLLGAAVRMCSFFLPADKPVVSVEGRGEVKAVLKSEAGAKFPDLPLVVLINGNSASASEIFSACMSDYKRAVLVGERTFGKGSVQTLIPFGEQSGALRLTTAKYFTPGRRPIHGHGVNPDIVVPLSVAARIALSNQLNTHPGEILPLSPNPVRDQQLARAVEILTGMRIFRSLHADPLKQQP